MFHKAPPLRDFLRGRVQKKSPGFVWKTGDLPAYTLHRLDLEDFFVRNIQAGFLTLPPFQQPSRLETTFLTVAINLLKGFPFSFRKGRDYSGGSVPDFPDDTGSRGSLRLDITFM
jgi:hypothetical protein